MGPLRIGIIAPPWFSVPPSGYGGVELVVSYLADGLVERGHDVTLFASGGSETAARLCTVYDEPPSAQIGNAVFEARHLAAAYSRWRDFDVIHDHTLTGLATGAALPIPVLHTMHGPVIPEVGELYKQVSPSVQLLAISKSQAATLPDGVDATVIYNGIRPGDFPFSSKPGDYLLFVGRINPDKGVVEAADIARRANMPLVIVCKINEAAERDYWESTVRPCLAGLDVEVREQPPLEEKLRLYRDAYATLFPIQWPEPFGLVMVESMATGTPVIAFPRGAAPEVIKHGETGFLVESVAEAVDVLPKVAELDRRCSRERVELHFSEARNVLLTERSYYDAVASQRIELPQSVQLTSGGQ